MSKGWEKADCELVATYQQILKSLKASRRASVVIASASLDGDQLIRWIDKFKPASPSTTVFAQFTKSEFDDSNLDKLLQAGADGYLLETPSISTVAKLYTKVTGVVMLQTVTKGTIALYDKAIHVGEKKMALTPNEAIVLREIMAAGGQVIGRARLMSFLGHCDLSKTHSLATHVWRLRGKMEELGLPNSIVTASDKERGFSFSIQ